MSDFFPRHPGATPMIYAYVGTHPDHADLLKVGYAEGDLLERIKAGVAPARTGE